MCSCEEEEKIRLIGFNNWSLGRKLDVWEIIVMVLAWKILVAWEKEILQSVTKWRGPLTVLEKEILDNIREGILCYT